ncbi:2-isopropylmalate synthase [Coprococcus catus]|uniref:2-isopropylmalate synthase n=1 Tax=Coprococcus catus TaxID=116085 RepID=UPI001C8BBC4A|nr:2-isopropylmalate synthase [Coprococcus catus]MBX9232458.1 2-isopropylmalate synthase [Coprococcus catus]MCT6799363.1 2-isopropylmalate synthase [Coprococcus catus]
MLNYKRYKRVPVLNYPERQWPNKEIQKAPIWCSVDLRDGNQALIEPMVVEEKIEFFKLLVKLGFKEIEVGFPAASQIEYDFLRTLVEQNLIPDDVKVQVLIQCREHLIKRTFEAIQGCKNVIIHIYNSTSTLQRDVVFDMNREEIKQIAIDGTEMVKKYMKGFDGNIQLQYSPESFTGTEMDFALEICEAVKDVWQPTVENPIIFNLPATVEMTTPNVYADQIEWMSTHFTDRDKIILSIHPHNDRGCGVAASELALLAGADRIEGTLFGNGERTGNVDVLNIAYNMFSQGINPELDIENVNEIIEVYERCTKMDIDPRHPYAGKLVFTAFSGSHQDAINKGVHALEQRKSPYWEVPYLPIDPSDLGRKYEPIVRINSQSGKGGVAFVMDHYYGFKLPKVMHKELSDEIQAISERQGEVSPSQIMDKFREMYINAKYPLHFRKMRTEDISETVEGYDTKVVLTYTFKDELKTIEGFGNGPIDAVKHALCNQGGFKTKLTMYEEHALTTGSDSQAASYIELMNSETGERAFGVGISSNITRSSVRAIFSAMNRLFFRKK